jgi:hypothetical protein
MISAESAPQRGLYFHIKPWILCSGSPSVALSALVVLLGLPRATLRAETSPSLALGYFYIAPSALKDDGINGQTRDTGVPPRTSRTILPVPRPRQRLAESSRNA